MIAALYKIYKYRRKWLQQREFPVIDYIEY